MKSGFHFLPKIQTSSNTTFSNSSLHNLRCLRLQTAFKKNKNIKPKKKKFIEDVIRLVDLEVLLKSGPFTFSSQ